VSPTGSLDEGTNKWTNLPNAYDNPMEPNSYYATCASATTRNTWGAFADFTLAAPIRCGRVRVDCDFIDTSDVDYVQVDVWNTDLPTPAWQTIYTGVVNNGTYTELTFSYRHISGMRFRFHYASRNAPTYWLYEVGFYSAPDTISPPAVMTLDATSVDVASANLHGFMSSDGGEPSQTWFQYGPTVAYGSTTTAQSGYLTDQTFFAFLSGLTGTYHFRAAASNSAGTSYGSDSTFTVNSVPLKGWVSPTASYTDPSPPNPSTGGGWANQTAAYDDEGLSGASLLHNLNDAAPGPYLYLTHPALTADKIRYQAKKTPEITYVDIWVLLDGVWINVYPAGTFNDAQRGTVWNEVSFTAGSVTAARVRFNIPTNYGLTAMLYEFDFHTVGGAEHCKSFIDGAFSGAQQ
jgi:hypothetical protein